MTLRKRKSTQDVQSARFIEAAKKTGADESGKTFSKVFQKMKITKKTANAKKPQ